LDARQVATGDGCRSLSEWAASRLDVSLETAKSLVRTTGETPGPSHPPYAAPSSTEMPSGL